MFDITHICHIDAPQSEVFKAITTVDGIKGWWTAETYGNAGAGGELAFEFGGKYRSEMQVVEVRENAYVEWEVVNSIDEWMGTKIRYELDQNEGKTRLRFSHRGYKAQNDFFAVCSFSWAKYMISLRSLVEAGEGQPYDVLQPMD